MTEKSDGPAVLVVGRGVTDDLVRRIQKAMQAVPDVAVISDMRAARDQLNALLAAMQSDELVQQERIIARLVEYADKIDQARRVGGADVDALIEGAPQGIGVHEIDNNKVIRRVSSSELRMLGYRHADMVGKPVWKFVVMQETAQRSIDKKMSGHTELKPFVRTYTRADGTPIRLVIVDRCIYDATGNVRGICSVISESALSAS